jgi:hypothetical protein
MDGRLKTIGVICAGGVLALVGTCLAWNWWRTGNPQPEANAGLSEHQAPKAESRPWSAIDSEMNSPGYLDRKDWKTVVKPIVPSEGIETGYLFALGHFVPRPYKVAIDDEYITINGIRVDEIPSPRPRSSPHYTDPGNFDWPKGVNGLCDPFNEYMFRKWHYLQSTLSRTAARKAAMEIAKSQPGIADAVWDTGGCLTLTCANGGTYVLMLRFDADEPDLHEIESNAREQRIRARASFEDALRRDQLLITSTNSGDDTGGGRACLRGATGAAAQEFIRRVVSIVESDRPQQEKLIELAGMLSKVFIAREILENLEIDDDLRKACGSAQ